MPLPKRRSLWLGCSRARRSCCRFPGRARWPTWKTGTLAASPCPRKSWWSLPAPARQARPVGFLLVDPTGSFFWLPEDSFSSWHGFLFLVAGVGSDQGRRFGNVRQQNSDCFTLRFAAIMKALALSATGGLMSISRRNLGRLLLATALPLCVASSLFQLNAGSGLGSLPGLADKGQVAGGKSGNHLWPRWSQVGGNGRGQGRRIPALVAGMKDNTKFQANGIVFGGVKYMYLTNRSPQGVVGRKGRPPS